MTGMRNVDASLRKAMPRELLAVKKCEQRLEAKARNTGKASWKSEIESRIPQKVYVGLESAFVKGFSFESKGEQYWILKMLETALITGEKWSEEKNATDYLMESDWTVTDLELCAQIQKNSIGLRYEYVVAEIYTGNPGRGVPWRCDQSSLL